MSRFTRQALVDSFLKLAEGKSLDKLTVREIVLDCGLNRNTFYYYFTDIYALAEEILVSISERAAARCRETGSLAQGGAEIVRWIHENRELFLNLYEGLGRDSTEHALSGMLEPAFRTCFARLQENGKMPNADPAVLTMCAHHVFFGMLFDHVQHGFRTDLTSELMRTEQALFG